MVGIFPQRHPHRKRESDNQPAFRPRARMATPALCCPVHQQKEPVSARETRNQPLNHFSSLKHRSLPRRPNEPMKYLNDPLRHHPPSQRKERVHHRMKATHHRAQDQSISSTNGPGLVAKMQPPSQNPTAVTRVQKATPENPHLLGRGPFDAEFTRSRRKLRLARRVYS